MKNWKTTVAGVAAGMVLVLDGVKDTLAHGQPIQWTMVVLGLAIAALGAVAKDFTSQ